MPYAQIDEGISLYYELTGPEGGQVVLQLGGGLFGRHNFELVRSIVGLNDPYTVRQACLAMEEMDLSPLVPQITRPLLMTNGTHDVLCPPDLAPSGLGARRMAELNENITLVEFPDIGHADLVECPQDAIRIVTEVRERALVPARR